MSAFAEELRELIDKWRDLLGLSDEDIVDELMDQVEEFAEDVIFDN